MTATVRVTGRGVQRLRGGHPWIWRADVVGEVPDGEVLVADERGRPLASALASASAPIALRVYARGEAFAAFDELLPARLAQALARRVALYGELPPACRLVHAEADQLPGLFVDRWGDAIVLQSTTAAMDHREARVAGLLQERLGARLVVSRDDGSTRELEGLPRKKGVLAGGGPTIVEVGEGAGRFRHDLLEDAKTGGFLDQRENHLRAGELARGQALDLFSHHGGFAVALAARADHVEAVELDARAAARAEENARLSGRANVTVRRADAFAVLREHEAARRQFDLVVVDPPALAKRAGGGPQKGGGAPRGPGDAALRAYKELNLRALRVTRPGGFLVTCSCSAKMTVAVFGDMLLDAARDSGRTANVLERRGAAGDHPVLLGLPESEYLKCWILQVL